MILRLSFVFACILVHRSQGSPLHGGCLSTDDCGTIDTYCKNQTCVCRENFTVWYDSCVQMPSPALRCSKKLDCHSKLGARSMCTKKGYCACKPFHHLHQGQCVKNRDLHDQCEHDHQCYCGSDCESKIACIHKNCTCKPGHVPYRIRRCIRDPSYIDIPDESLLSTTVHKHKSIEQIDHKSIPHTELKHSERKIVEQEQNILEQKKTKEQKEKEIEASASVEQSTSKANTPIFGQYLVVSSILILFVNLRVVTLYDC